MDSLRIVPPIIRDKHSRIIFPFFGLLAQLGCSPAQFIRNKAVRYWMDNQSVAKADLYALCKDLAQEFPFAKKLNSAARQASAERAWAAISSFYARCKKGEPKKGYPTFKKHCRSVE